MEKKKYLILVINPGSTSTKIAVFQDRKNLFLTTIRHSNEELSPFKNIAEQFEFRKNIIIETLKNNNVCIEDLNAIVGRGGLLHPLEGGTYEVNEKMVEELKMGKYGEHASNLGAIIAFFMANELGIKAYIVDPVVVDEMEEIAKISGMKAIERKSIFHALNQRAVAKKCAKEEGKKYNEVTYIVVHMGGGISVGLHHKGRVIDVNNALDGDGPFSPERSGGVPIGQLVELCFSGKYTKADIKKMIKGKGGWIGYLGTNNGLEVSEMADKGDKYAKLIIHAMAYQVAKEIGALATVVNGKVDNILITGGLAYDKDYLMPLITERVSFIAPVKIYPGEDEMLALAEGTLNVIIGDEKIKHYE